MTTQIFAADDPLVLDGTHDVCGYKPGERARIAKGRARSLHAEENAMAKRTKKKPAPPHRVNTVKGRGARPESREVAPPGRKGRPRQQDLPGTEDRAIKPLEEAAQDYAEIRDRRMALNAEEVGLKAKVLRLMKHHGKQAYHRDGVSIEIVVEEETVKVRVKKVDDETDETTTDEHEDTVDTGSELEA